MRVTQFLMDKSCGNLVFKLRQIKEWMTLWFFATVDNPNIICLCGSLIHPTITSITG